MLDLRNNCSIKSIDTECTYVNNSGYGFDIHNGNTSYPVNGENPHTVRLVIDDLSPYSVYNCFGSVINVAGQSAKDVPITVPTKEAGMPVGYLLLIHY